MILYVVGRSLSQFWNDATQWIELHTAESVLVLGVLILGGGYLAKWLLNRKSTRSEALRVMRESLSAQQPEESSEMSFFVANKSQSERAAPKPKERVIREKTREDISTMFNTLKSIPQETKAELPPVEFVDPQWLSDVATDESKMGKFSKMTVSAVLVFDQNDLKEKLDDWALKNNREDSPR